MVTSPRISGRGLGWAAAVTLFGMLAGFPGDALAQRQRQGLTIEEVIVTPIGNPIYQYTFKVSTEPGFAFSFNNYFAIYDLPKIVPVPDLQPPLTNNHGEPPFWLYEEIRDPGLGPYPLGSLPPGVTDDPLISNVVWTYRNPTVQATGYLGEFYVVLDDFVRGPWFVVALLLDLETGIPTPFQAIIQTPQFGDPNFIVVPEPGSVVLSAIGLATVGGAGWLRRRRRRIPA